MPEIDASAMSARHSRLQSFDHHEDMQATAIDELIGNEVERPALIRSLWNCQWRPRA